MAQQTKWARMKNPKHIWKWNSLAQKLHSNLGPSSRISFQVPSHSKLFSLFYFCEISLLFSCGTTVFNRWLQAQHTEAEWKLMLRPRECFVMQFLCPRNRNMHCLVWVRVQGRVVHENKFRKLLQTWAALSNFHIIVALFWEHLQEFAIFYLAYLVFCQLLKRYAK